MIRSLGRLLKNLLLLGCVAFFIRLTVQHLSYDRTTIIISPRQDESKFHQKKKDGHLALIPDSFMENIPNISQHQYRYLLTPDDSNMCINNPLHHKSVESTSRKGKLLILFMVHSKPDHFEHRKIIRETWGSVGKQFSKLIFLLGNPQNTTLERLVSEENSIHNDILQEDFDDVYRNITLKNVMGLKWAAQQCFNARYVVKSDDDMYINSRLLIRTMINSAISRRNLILCKIHYFKNVPRGGKYQIDKAIYSSDSWPSFCFGGCWIMSMDVVRKLYDMSLQTRQIYLDDVYVTGILRTKLSLSINYLSKAYRLFCHTKGNSTLVKELWNTFGIDHKKDRINADKKSPVKVWNYCFT